MVDFVGQLLREVAATVVMPRFASLLPHQTEMKSANEPVTVADREAEKLIADALSAFIPGSRVVGEEACSANAALLEGMSEGTVWIVDPIDGTANFAAGRGPFAMMVALLRHGETVGSWIYDPQRDRLAVAERGAGAWIAGERVTVSAASDDHSQWHGIVSCAFAPDDELDRIERVCALVGRADATARCAGFEYPLVANGERTFALYWRTLVWDHAPGALLVSEAGGRVVHLDGSPYSPLIARSGLLIAQDSSVAARLLGLGPCPLAAD
jgi:fructose-1,6-bisphosphatase/inositol monophosphatase family enzyme